MSEPMKGKKVFLLDDDELINIVLGKALKKEGYNVHSEIDTVNIIEKISSYSPDVLLLDIDLPDRNGIDILEEIKNKDIDTEVIMLTADDRAENAIKAMKLGAIDYLTKPFDIEEVLIVVAKAVNNKKLKKEVNYYRKICATIFEKDLIGQSPPIVEMKAQIAKLVDAKVQTILITGESGTGKEVTARYIHRMIHGGCTAGYAPFVAINCAALPESILESELFGYEKGTFTDAKTNKKGVFEMAADGTILLDEIGEMRPDLQTKLLRVLEERNIRRLGGKEDIPLNAMVIATTNRNLTDAVAKKDFRMDLFYRLNAFAIQTKPLREIQGDILVLANFFLTSLAVKYNKNTIKTFSPEAQKLLQSYSWPGNVRELRNVIERIVVLEQAKDISPEMLPIEIGHKSIGFVERRKAVRSFVLPKDGISLEGMEKDLIKQALARANNNKTIAAKLLGISYNSIRWQLKKFNMD